MNQDSEAGPKSSQTCNPLIWDWPLRIWHWLIAICALTALLTGLFQDWNAMTIHRWAGIAVVALLGFRLLWGIWGGTYSRFRHYWTTPKRVISHFRGSLDPDPHTPPGIALAVCMMIALGIQSVAGLFTTDDVFIEGPFVRHVPDEVVEVATDLHHQVWWVIISLIAIHLIAHAVYGGILRSSIPLSMITGRKPVAAEPTQYSLTRALCTFGIAIGGFYVVLQYLR